MTIRSLTRTSIRHVVDRLFPSVANAYRLIRDERTAIAVPKATPFGFQLAGNDAMAAGTFEQTEITIFLKYLDQASVCIDVGANIGLYSCLARSRGKHVIAIEPLRTNLQLLYTNLLRNGFQDVEVFPLGLSSSSGIQSLYGGGTGASFVPGWAGASTKHFQLVPTTTLDTIVQQRFAGQLLIKMDVEGFENDVLCGATSTLRLLPRPTWIVEVALNQHFPGGINKHFVQTFETFWQYGYEARIAGITEQVVTPVDVDRWARQGRVDFGSYNYLFV
ncbi:MAG: FkbM family methyltransferase [Bryobacterales bacterium]|nr:FkbM family methyltransferase [Bryobacterales bacterium]